VKAASVKFTNIFKVCGFGLGQPLKYKIYADTNYAARLATACRR
jgi:hypothetical protein